MDRAEISEWRYLETKIYRQRAPAHALDRPALLARLDTFPLHGVIVVSAPAGYGKTTLVSQWAETLVEPVAWVSLDEEDGEARLFSRYVMAAINSVQPALGEATRAMLDSLQIAPTRQIADALISDLEDLDTSLTLVLDDYHLVEDSAAAEVTKRLVEYLPRRLRLVIVSRVRPSLPLARLKLHGLLGEISALELAFAGDEARELVSRLAGREVSVATTSALEKQTEGWATALALAGLSLRGQAESNLDSLSQADRATIFEFLIADVASRVDPMVLEFVSKTAVVDSFSADLCESLLREIDRPQGSRPTPAKQMIERIARANLFLVELDDNGEWYRYHHLFRDSLLKVLERSLATEEIAQLHIRASAWYEAHGLISEAIRHALAAGQEQGAAQIAERHFFEVLDTPSPKRFLAWLALLPQSVMERPGITIMRAVREHFAWRLAAAAQLAQEAVSRLGRDESELSAADQTALRAMSCMLQAQAAHYAGDSSSTTMARDAMELVQNSSKFIRNTSEVYMTVGLQLEHRSDEALYYISEQLDSLSSHDDARIARLLLATCAVNLFDGNLDALRKNGLALLRVSEGSGNRLDLGWSLMVLGIDAYERSDLDLAEDYFGQAVQLRYQVNAQAALESFVGMALSQLAQGRIDESQDTVLRAARYLSEIESYGLGTVLEPLKCQILLTRYAFAPAMYPLPRPYDPSPVITPKRSYLLIEHLIAARSQFCQGTSGALAIAQDWVERVKDEVIRTNQRRRLVEINTLAALVLDAQGQRSLALKAMEEAVAQGYNGGYVRSIVDAGPAVLPLLSELRASGSYPEYIDRLQLVLDDPSARRGPALAKLLTNREMEVLEFLAARKSNKEIAAMLYLSPLTVKRHTQSLFRKLGAANRREAVVLAREKGLPI